MFSQYGEDEVVAGLLDAAGLNSGRLLDIGAWHPTDKSNSRLLIERGWSAVLCEFTPGKFCPKPECEKSGGVRTLLEEYGKLKYRERVTIIQAAISVTDNGVLQRFDMTDDGLSTSDPAILQKWREQGGYFGKLWVPQLSLEHLLNQFGGGYEFVSFDAEGTSVDLVIHYLCDLLQEPRVVCVEYDDRLAELMGKVQGRGYKIAHLNGTNAILERK